MYFSQNLDNIWTTSIKILSKRFRKFTDSTLKSKQLIYFIINMLYNIITPSKTPYSAGKYVILPNPNRITLKSAKCIALGDAFFVWRICVKSLLL